METSSLTNTAQIINKDQLLSHWQGHRSLTRRTIEAFPEKELFEFSIGGMRTFAVIVKELLAIAAPGAKGLETDEWEELKEELAELKTKQDLLDAWDRSTTEINESFPKIEASTFQKKVNAFGMYENLGIDSLLYFIDNEIHHRGQGYVYLRALGIEPPFFWER